MVDDLVIDMKKRLHWTQYHCWMVRDGVVVAYCSLDATTVGRVELMDIEVREEYRGQKLSHQLLDLVEEVLGVPVVHEGGYTLAGLKAIAPIFHNEKTIAEKARELYEPTVFVHDWDNMVPRYP